MATGQIRKNESLVDLFLSFEIDIESINEKAYAINPTDNHTIKAPY